MKIGYPCINWSVDCKGNRTFRLRSYSGEKLKETVAGNLHCLQQILKYNIDRNILFFRITSDLVPFASHPVCKFHWQRHFQGPFREIGELIRDNDIRISMHPGQYNVVNSIRDDVFDRTGRELDYHAEVLDLMKLDRTAKIQIHVGGVFGDREAGKQRFIDRYKKLGAKVKKRLVIENDHVNYRLGDCLEIAGKIKVPVLFDTFHHEVLNSGESIKSSMEAASRTWHDVDGLPMVDYSSQKVSANKIAHADSINIKHFKKLLRDTRPFDFDVMLEIKNKEKSAVLAVEAAKRDMRFVSKVT